MQKQIRQTLLPGQVIQRQKPLNMVMEDNWIFEADQYLTIGEVPLFEYRNVNVSPESIVWSRLEIDRDLLIYPYHAEIYNWKYCLSNIIKRKCVRLPDDEYYLCTDYWAANYFHWMCDALPRVFMVKDMLSQSVLLLPGQYYAPYYLETLKAFKIREIKILPVKQYFSVPKLFSPPQPVISGQQYSALTIALREHLIIHFKHQFTGRHQYKNVYISRKKAAYRWVLNEDEVIEALKKYGFVDICFEDYPLQEQVEISYHAQNMISVHGANLTNIFYMQPGSNVLEFRKPKAAPGTGNNSYWILADSVGVNYFYLNCNTIDRSEGRMGNYFDVTVNISALEQELRRML